MHRRSARRGTRERGRRGAPIDWYTRIRALLAGALVFGIGSTLTLAAWTDTETARGSFTASTFGILGSTDGTNFAEHSASGPAALSFTAPVTAMSPGSTSYAKFTVKTTSATNVAGTLVLGGATVTGTGLGGYLTYGVRTISAATTTACDANTFASGTTVVPSGSALTTGAGSAQALAAAGGSPVAYCFAVTLPTGTSSAAQGLTATATWTLTGTSAS